MNLVKEIIDGRTDMTSEEIGILTEMIKDLYYKEQNVVSIPGERVIFVGDLHGDLGAAKTVYEVFRRHKEHSLVFLGDYADRGPYQVETVNYVFAMALLHSNKVTILRGNHESERVANAYGFYLDATRKHSAGVFRRYLEAFEALPIAGRSENGVFACHGGVPENVTTIEDIQHAKRHTTEFENQIIMQLVWNDPIEADV
ncbi:MAG: metallophosphoesterase, partial [Candidatus Thorarchaeota archaeon]